MKNKSKDQLLLSMHCDAMMMYLPMSCLKCDITDNIITQLDIMQWFFLNSSMEEIIIIIGQWVISFQNAAIHLHRVNTNVVMWDLCL